MKSTSLLRVKGFDYNETFVPVAKFATFRVMLALVVVHDREMDQLDVKTAFLNSRFNEEVYMELPAGYEVHHKVCWLNKAPHCLKQAPRKWYTDIHTDLVKSIGFTRSVDHTNLMLKADSDYTSYSGLVIS